MEAERHRERIARCRALMRDSGLDAFFHGEAAPPPLAANTAIAIGNCGLYTGPWGIRVEDTVVVRAVGAEIVTAFRYGLTP